MIIDKDFLRLLFLSDYLFSVVIENNTNKERHTHYADVIVV